ncbi:class I histocompatibility antigen, F10 alpha chain-like [Eublepharis macularius]|uniref:Class I histocompatibility antigen, F10 alpha chain-like n=1 Tax=Eublepharis macularius TaxID=481883 RepID=A0AA97J496_EUBMA|nr:class I histocompatibility antigen, F10 alpha chain-like [Eublepharis macularius]
MNSLQRRLLFLVGGLALLQVGGSGSSSSHSLRYFYTSVRDPGQALPQYYFVGYVDDQPFVFYDAARRALPKVPWMEKAGKEDPQYWERNTQNVRNAESQFRVYLDTLRERYNQNSSTGLHTWQWMYGCEVGPDGRPRGGKWQYAYDGEDFIAFDKETLTWTAADRKAEITKQKWDPLLATSQRCKFYLEEECVEWLGRYLGYGNETLRRRERPTVKVARKEGYDGQETLICQAHGFYPKEIDIAWTKDGEDQWQDTFHGGVAPNSDGTYYTWLSIEVDPKDRGRYRCKVGHSSLPEDLDLAWEEPVSYTGLILGLLVPIMVAFTLLMAVVFVIYFLKRRHQRRGYTSKSTLITEKSSPGLYPGHVYIPC